MISWTYISARYSSYKEQLKWSHHSWSKHLISGVLLSSSVDVPRFADLTVSVAVAPRRRDQYIGVLHPAIVCKHKYCKGISISLSVNTLGGCGERLLQIWNNRFISCDITRSGLAITHHPRWWRLLVLFRGGARGRAAAPCLECGDDLTDYSRY